MYSAKEKAAKAAYYRAHREEILARKVVYHAAHRGERNAYNAAYRASRRDSANQRSAAWRAAHPEQNRANIARWQSIHRDEQTAKRAEWAAAHPERTREHRRRSKAIRRGARLCDHLSCRVLGPTSLAWQTSEHVCWICATPVIPGGNLHMDHVIPIAQGGLHCAENLRPACATCNLRKGSQLPHPVTSRSAATTRMTRSSWGWRVSGSAEAPDQLSSNEP